MKGDSFAPAANAVTASRLPVFLLAMGPFGLIVQTFGWKFLVKNKSLHSAHYSAGHHLPFINQQATNNLPQLCH